MLEHREPSPPFSGTTDIWMVSAETGRVVFEGMPSARFYNPMGVIHGGWIATLLDSCMGCDQWLSVLRNISVGIADSIENNRQLKVPVNQPLRKPRDY
jgi:acyl-coenzyme A thioesterase PaaI-like protein